MIQVEPIDSSTIRLNMEGDISGADYQEIKPELEAIFEKNGKQKFLFNLENVEKFDPAAIYQDIKFDLQHFKYIGSTAVVTTRPFAHTLVSIANATYPVTIEHFEDLNAATEWLNSQKA